MIQHNWSIETWCFCSKIAKTTLKSIQKCVWEAKSRTHEITSIGWVEEGVPGKYLPTMRRMRLEFLSEPWRRRNCNWSRSEKSSSGERYWEQSCQFSSSCCWSCSRKGRASTPRSDASTTTEKSSDEPPIAAPNSCVLLRYGFYYPYSSITRSYLINHV